jgi:hypothetical protein
MKAVASRRLRAKQTPSKPAPVRRYTPDPKFTQTPEKIKVSLLEQYPDQTIWSLQFGGELGFCYEYLDPERQGRLHVVIYTTGVFTCSEESQPSHSYVSLEGPMTIGEAQDWFVEKARCLMAARAKSAAHSTAILMKGGGI